jgi:hypothetical protein
MLGAPVYAQQLPTIVGRGAELVVVRDDAELPAGTPLAEDDEIRTGPSSFAELGAGGGVRFVMGAGTSMTVTESESLPSVRLDQGTLAVRTRFEAVRVESIAGVFVLSGVPAEANFEITAGRLAVQVLTGEVTAEDVDSQAPVLRGPNDRAERSFTAGFTEGFKQTLPSSTGWFPNVYVGYPGAEVPQFPQPVAPRPVPQP